MSPSTKLTAAPVVPPAEGVRRPRASTIADVWLTLGDGIAPLSNGSGRPLARTVKLILDPLVIRPLQNPGLADGTLTPDAAAELQGRIRDALADLEAASAWFLLLKRVRRQLRITDGNPQDLYFQRCFELARTSGTPDVDAEAIAVETVTEIAQTSGDSLLTRVRELLRDPVESDRLRSALVTAWGAREGLEGPADATLLATALDACAGDGDLDAAFEDLSEASAGSAAAADVVEDGAARTLGLTVHPHPQIPALGETASKRDLPRPFDRSIFERLFAALSSSTRHDLELDADELVEEEILRSAQPWELAIEHSRVLMLLGAEASRALEPTELLRPTTAHRLLRARWEREAYVRRVLRLPGEISGVPEAIREDVHAVRQGYLRRLWVRLHGRELRGREPGGTTNLAAEVWDTLDGVLRSVVMDQRQRLKLAIGRELSGVA